VQIVRTPARTVVPAVEKHEAAAVQVAATARRPVRRTLKRPAVAAPKPAEQPLEAWSDFVEVPYAPPLGAHEGGQVLRVQLPRSYLQSFGISIPAERAFDRFNADVMVGQDGVVRAIRFVK